MDLKYYREFIKGPKVLVIIGHLQRSNGQIIKVPRACTEIRGIYTGFFQSGIRVFTLDEYNKQEIVGIHEWSGIHSATRTKFKPSQTFKTEEKFKSHMTLAWKSVEASGILEWMLTDPEAKKIAEYNSKEMKPKARPENLEINQTLAKVYKFNNRQRNIEDPYKDSIMIEEEIYQAAQARRAHEAAKEETKQPLPEGLCPSQRSWLKKLLKRRTRR